MYVNYYIRYQGNYKGATDWKGVQSQTLKEIDIDGTLSEVKAIELSPFILDPNSYWHDYGDISTYRPPSEDDLMLGNFIVIYPDCTLEATVEGRKIKGQNESVKIGLCEPCRQRYLRYHGLMPKDARLDEIHTQYVEGVSKSDFNKNYILKTCTGESHEK